MITLVIAICAFLLLSGFLAGTEAALLSITDAEVESLLHKRRLGSKILKKVDDDIHRAVIAIVIVTNIVNVGGPVVVSVLATDMFGSSVIGIVTAVLTFGTILFSEIIPKTMGIHYSERISLAVAPMIYVLIRILSPVIFVLDSVTKVLKYGERKVGTEDQIRSLVTIGRREGHIESDEGRLIHRAFIMNDKRAEDIMTPLKDIIDIDLHATVAQAAEQSDLHAHSRYPVFGSSIHEVEGFILNQDILRALADGKDQEGIRQFLREPLIIDGHIRCDVLLAKFRDEHKHLAIVQLQGHTVGLVTLEDVLEELVGDIEDETDMED